MDTYETTSWSCTGPKNKRHRKRELENYEVCPECGRDRATAEQEEQSKNSSPTLLQVLLLGVALIAFFGFGGAFLYSRLNPSDSDPTPVKPIIVPNPHDYPWEPDRFTKGQRTLFPGKGNANRDFGLKAFQNGNYDDAVKSFKLAVEESRNDPEVLILYNNAFARQQARQQNNKPLTLATVVPVENNQDFAEQMLRGVAMAQNEFNQNYGVNGRLLEIVIANDGNKPENATKVAERLVNDKSILGVIGHNSSGASGAALKIYESANLAMISPTSTSTSLEGDVFFRTVPSDEAAGKKLADYIDNELFLERVVIFYVPGSLYSMSLSDAFTENFNGTVVDKIDISDPNIDIKKEFHASIGIDQPQAALLFPSTKFIGNAIRIAKFNADKKPKDQRLKLLGGDTLYRAKTLIEGREAVEGLILAVSWSKDSLKSQKFKEAGEQQWGGSVDWRTAMSYDATQAFLSTFSKNPSRNSMIKELRRIQLLSDDTSGDILKFTSEGEREGESVLVKATKGAKYPAPPTQFGFELVE